jgi:hypothetical protein
MIIASRSSLPGRTHFLVSLVPVCFLFITGKIALGSLILSSSVVGVQYGDSNQDFGISLQSSGIGVLNVGSQLTDFSYQITTLGPPPPSGSSYPYSTNYSSSTTITNTTINRDIGVLIVRGSGIGSYFEDKRVQINNILASVTVNGQELIVSSGVSFEAPRTAQFAIHQGVDFFHFTFSNPPSSLTITPTVGDSLPSSFLKLDSISDSLGQGYQLVEALPPVMAIPEPSSSISLAVLASIFGVAGRRRRAPNKPAKV